ncbi:hypothetical protein C0416_04910 [bacterium]|nr:hypothetical protein [bacterium]
MENGSSETPTKKLSLAELAQAAIKAAKDGDAKKKQKEQTQEAKRVEGLLNRLKEIDSEFEEVEKVIKGVSNQLREQVRATLKGDTDVLANEGNNILNDEGVQLVHIKELTNEVSGINSWDALNDIVKEAIDRGWFEDRPRNAKGNINLETLIFPDHKNPELKRAMANLKRAISSKVSEMVRSRQEKGKGKKEQ